MSKTYTTPGSLLELVTEGVWSPEIWDTTKSGSEGQTYGPRYGYYIKVGSIVTITGSIWLSNKGTLTAGDAVYIGQLPFQAAAADGLGVFSVSNGNAVTVTAGVSLIGSVAVNQQDIQLQQANQTSGNTSVTVSQLTTNSGVLIFTGSYKAAYS